MHLGIFGLLVHSSNAFKIWHLRQAQPNSLKLYLGLPHGCEGTQALASSPTVSKIHTVRNCVKSRKGT